MRRQFRNGICVGGTTGKKYVAIEMGKASHQMFAPPAYIFTSKLRFSFAVRIPWLFFLKHRFLKSVNFCSALPGHWWCSHLGGCSHDAWGWCARVWMESLASISQLEFWYPFQKLEILAPWHPSSGITSLILYPCGLQELVEVIAYIPNCLNQKGMANYDMEMHSNRVSAQMCSEFRVCCWNASKEGWGWHAFRLVCFGTVSAFGLISLLRPSIFMVKDIFDPDKTSDSEWEMVPTSGWLQHVL